MENQAKEFKNTWSPKFVNNCKIMKIIILKKRYEVSIDHDLYTLQRM